MEYLILEVYSSLVKRFLKVLHENSFVREI